MIEFGGALSWDKPIDENGETNRQRCQGVPAAALRGDLGAVLELRMTLAFHRDDRMIVGEWLRMT